MEGFRQKGLRVGMNSQWPFAMNAYEEMCGKLDKKRQDRFFVLMSPFSPGKEMIPESIPHSLSLLYCSQGEGEVRDLSVECPLEREMLIRFTYLSKRGTCDVTIRLINQREQPREFQFGFDDQIVSRRIDLRNYEIYFQHEGREMKIVDPVALSVENFMKAAGEGREPLVGGVHILNNLHLLKKIYDGYEAVAKRASWKR